MDYEKIGRKMRIGEGGVFLRHGSGYVTQVEEITQAFSTLDLELKAPDYAALLEVSVPDTEQTGRMFPSAMSRKPWARMWITPMCIRRSASSTTFSRRSRFRS